MEIDGRSSAPTWTFVYAVFWGGYSAIMLFVMAERTCPSFAAAILTSLSGVIVIGLGFAVYRRSQIAAWLLVAFALSDLAARIVGGRSGLVMPIPLLAFSLLAAMYLRKQAKASTAWGLNSSPSSIGYNVELFLPESSANRVATRKRLAQRGLDLGVSGLRVPPMAHRSRYRLSDSSLACAFADASWAFIAFAAAAL